MAPPSPALPPALTLPAQPTSPSVPLPEPLPEQQEDSFSLEQLINLAALRNPQLAIARNRATAARGQLIQAGLYPNPTVIWEAEDVGNGVNAAGAEGPIIGQQIVTAGKLRLARAAAAQGVAAADWQAITRWFDVLTRVRTAYYEVLTAQRTVQTTQEIVRIAQEGLDVAKKLLKAGTGTQPDVLRAQVELEQNRVQLAVSQQRREAAWKLLAVAVGVPALPAVPLEGELDAAAPRYDWEPLIEAVLTRSSEVQEAHANVLQAEQLLRRARAEAVPNLVLSVRPLYNFPDQEPQVTVMAGSALPIFNRNQGNILSAEADLARTQQEVRQAELRLTDRLTTAYQRYRVARQQIDAYEKQILPNAQESLRLVRLGYEKSDPKYDYTALLQAQQILAQARLLYAQALGDLWRAVSEIAGLLQE